MSKKCTYVVSEVFRAEMSTIFLHNQQKQEAKIMKQFKLELPKAAVIVNLQFKLANCMNIPEKISSPKGHD